jgi:hypothetical protein
MHLHFPPGRRAVRRHFLPFAAGLALCGLLAAQAQARPTAPQRSGAATRFACDRGVGFNVAYVRGGVWVTTAGGRWLLRQAPSSIGRRYASPNATFILDEDRAALVGLPGGPFLRCVAVAPGGAPGRPGRQA